MSFIDHLEALRWHVIRSVLFVFIAAIVFFIFIDFLFDQVIMGPTRNDFISYRALCSLSHTLGMGESLCMPPMTMKLQVTSVSGTFMSSITIAIALAIVVAVPYLLWEIWRFVKPALKPTELKHTRGIILWVSMFFFIGAAFGYFVMAPFTFNFLANFTLGTVGAYKYMPTLDDYIDTLNNIILGCGIAFELPVMAYVLAKIGLITAGFLKRYRKYAFVVILIISAVITPSPDWTSQTIVAIPLLILYEISVVIVARVDRQKAKEEKEWS